MGAWNPTATWIEVWLLQTQEDMKGTWEMKTDTACVVGCIVSPKKIHEGAYIVPI